MEIKTERLFIRKLTAADWADIKKIWDDFRVSEYAKYDVPHKTDDDEIRALASKWEDDNKGKTNLLFAVCLENEVIGYIDFHDTGSGYECGYCFRSDHHGKGYAKESFRALIGLFSDIGVKKLTAGTAMKNIPSVRLLNSLGFQLVGTEKVSFYKDELGNDIYFDGGIFELNIITSD